MNKIHEKYIEQAKSGNGKLMEFDFSELVKRVYCKDSGLLKGEYCDLDPRGNRTSTGYYIGDAVPTEECNVHVPVEWCTATKSVAGDGCPRESVSTIALVKNENRRIEKKVFVWDAQYTYMELPEGYVFPNDTTLPYYMNLYIDGTYPGFTSDVTRPCNSYCVEHNPENTTSWEELCTQYALEHPEEEEEDE